MKRSTRLFSVLLAFILVLTSMSFTVSAYDVDDGVSVEEAATILLDYIDAILAVDGGVEEIPSPISVEIDYHSIDSAIKGINDLCKKLDNPFYNILLGQAKDLDNSAIKNIQRSSGDLKTLYALIEFLNKNSIILASFVEGNLDLGIANFLLGDSLEFDATGEINDIIYESLINGEGKRTDSVYKNYNSDQLLNVAIEKLLVDNIPGFNKSIDITKTTPYGIVAEYMDSIYNDAIAPYLNADIKKFLAEDVCLASYNDGVVTPTDETNDFYNLVNWDYEFTADTYNFAAASASYGGTIAQANDLLCTIVETVFSSEAIAELALVRGSNDNIQENITKLIRYILPSCPASFFYEGFDMNSIKAENISSMELEDMAVLVLRAVALGEIDDLVLPDDIDSLEVLIALVLNAIAADNGLLSSYDSLIYEDVATQKLLNKTDAEWIDVILTILVDFGVKELNKVVDIGLPPSKVAEYKAKGWTWENFLEDVADWAINYAGGVFVVFDNMSGFERGKIDGGGCWNKLNVLVNSLLPLQFLNGVSSASYVCDLEKLFKDAILENLLDFNFKGFLDLVEENNNSGNLLNENISSALLKLVQKIINGIFPNAIHNGATTSFTAFTSASNLGTIIKNLLSALNSRKVKLLNTLLPLIVDIMGSDLNIKTTPKLALSNMDSVVKPGDSGYDLRIMSSFTQAEAATYLKGFEANKVASGYLGKEGIIKAGTIIAKKSTADYYARDLTLADVNGKDIFNLEAKCIYTNKANTSGTGYYYFAAAVKNIKTANATTPIYAIGYVVYKTAAGERVVYTPSNIYIAL